MVVSITLDSSFATTNDAHELWYTSQKYSSVVILFATVSCLRKLRMGGLGQMTRLEVLASVFLSENGELSPEETENAVLSAEIVMKKLEELSTDSKIDREVMSRYNDVLLALSLGRSFIPWAGLKGMDHVHKKAVFDAVTRCQQMLSSPEHFPVNCALDLKLYIMLRTVQHAVMSSIMETKSIKNPIISKCVSFETVDPIVTFDSSVIHLEAFRKDWVKFGKQLGLLTKHANKIVNDSLAAIGKAVQ
jgi:hypothetical protein